MNALVTHFRCSFRIEKFHNVNRVMAALVCHCVQWRRKQNAWLPGIDYGTNSYYIQYDKYTQLDQTVNNDNIANSNNSSTLRCVYGDIL